MTRDEFMQKAQKEINQVSVLLTHKNRLMNLVMKAWEEGKKNAEVSNIEDIIKEAIDKIYQQPITAHNIHFDHQLKWSLNTDIPSACQGCSNHPSNGGSGICNCVMGLPQIKC